MTSVPFNNSCRFNATSGGTGDFIVASHVTGYKTPEEALATDGKTYHYWSQSSDGLTWEEGRGAYDYATDKLARTTILANSLGTTAKIDFAAAPIVDVFPSPSPMLEAVDYVPATSRILFWQAAAPTGWTKLTTHNDKALRVVSGTGGGNGGSYAFSTVFGRYQTDSHAIDSNELTYHAHTSYDVYGDGAAINVGGAYNGAINFVDHGRGTTTAGANYGHVHGVEMRVYYLDMIICEKN